MNRGETLLSKKKKEKRKKIRRSKSGNELLY